MYLTNEQFLKDIAIDFPDTDWDNLPDVSTCPDVFVVKGKSNEDKGTYDFEIDKEYTTKEEAEAQVKRMETWENVVPGSVEIIQDKSKDILYKYWVASCLKDIKEGKKVFPLLLP